MIPCVGVQKQGALFVPLYSCAGSHSPTPVATLGGAEEAKITRVVLKTRSMKS